MKEILIGGARTPSAQEPIPYVETLALDIFSDRDLMMKLKHY
ncbi:MAG: hypothetical protein HY929_05100 [Euryarchaeota archaeon]|nr:hypothetical protein [Euryarchaeota archaeon]